MIPNKMDEIPPLVKEKLDKMTILLKSAQSAIATLKAENDRLKKENDALNEKIIKMEDEKKLSKVSESKSPPRLNGASPKIVMKKIPLEPKLKSNIANSMMGGCSGALELNLPSLPSLPSFTKSSAPKDEDTTKTATPVSLPKESKIEKLKDTPKFSLSSINSSSNYGSTSVPEVTEKSRKRKFITGLQPLVNTESNPNKILQIFEQLSEDNYRAVAKQIVSFDILELKRKFSQYLQTGLLSSTVRSEWNHSMRNLLARRSEKSIPNISEQLMKKLKIIVKLITVLVGDLESPHSLGYGLAMIHRLRGLVIASSRSRFGVNYQWTIFDLGLHNVNIESLFEGASQMIPQLIGRDNNQSKLSAKEDLDEDNVECELQHLEMNDSDFESEKENEQEDSVAQEGNISFEDTHNGNHDMEVDSGSESNSDEDYECFEKLLESKLREEKTNEVSIDEKTDLIESDPSHESKPNSEQTSSSSLSMEERVEEILFVSDLNDFCAAYILLYSVFNLGTTNQSLATLVQDVLRDFTYVVNLSHVPGVAYALLHWYRSNSLLESRCSDQVKELVKVWYLQSRLFVNGMNLKLNEQMAKYVPLLYEQIKLKAEGIMNVLQYECKKFVSLEELDVMIKSSNESMENFLQHQSDQFHHLEMKQLSSIINLLPLEASLQQKNYGHMSIVSSWMKFKIENFSSSLKLVSIGNLLGTSRVHQIISDLLSRLLVFSDPLQLPKGHELPPVQLCNLLDDDVLIDLRHRSSHRFHCDFLNQLHEDDLVKAFYMKWKSMMPIAGINDSRQVSSLDELIEDHDKSTHNLSNKEKELEQFIRKTLFVVSGTHSILLSPILQLYDKQDHGWSAGNSGEGIKLGPIITTRIGALRDLLSKLAYKVRGGMVLRKVDLNPRDFVDSSAGAFFFQRCSASFDQAIEICYLLNFMQREILREDRLRHIYFSESSDDSPSNKDELILLEKTVMACCQLIHLLSLLYMERILHIHTCQLRGLLKCLLELYTISQTSCHEVSLRLLINQIGRVMFDMPTPWGPICNHEFLKELKPLQNLNFRHTLLNSSFGSHNFVLRMLRQQSTMLPAFLLNLDRRPDRYRNCMVLGDCVGLNFVRISGFDGKFSPYQTRDLMSLLEDPQYQVYSPLKISKNEIAERWNTSLNHLFDKNCPTNIDVDLTASELGCAAGHLKIWKYIAEMHNALSSRKGEHKLTNDPEFASMLETWREYFHYYYATVELVHAFPHDLLMNSKPQEYDDFYLIFEDDIKINPNLFQKFRQEVYNIINRAKNYDWDIIYLGAALPSSSSHFKYSFLKNGYFMSVNYAWMLHGYILRGKSAAKLLTKLPIVGPVDNFIARLIYDKEIKAIVLSDYIVTQRGRMYDRLIDSNIDRSQGVATHGDNNEAMDTTNKKFLSQRTSKLLKRRKSRQHKNDKVL